MGEQEENVVMETETVEPGLEVETESESVVETASEDAVTAAEPAPEEAADAADAAPVNPNWKWYVVNSPTGHENRAKASLEDRIKSQGMEELFGEILIPTENLSLIHI